MEIGHIIGIAFLVWMVFYLLKGNGSDGADMPDMHEHHHDVMGGM